MPVASAVKLNLERSSWIRKMFEEGRKLKEQFGDANVFDFSLGNPDLEPPPELLKALKAAVETTQTGTHSYMPNSGYPFARSAMAQKVSGEHNVPATADDVILTVGAAGAINVVFKTILNPGDEVMVIKPYFAEYSFYIDNHRGTIVAVDAAPDFSIDVKAVAAALTPKTAAIIVNTPNNPTGRIYPRADLEALAAVLTKHGKACGRFPYMLVDEPYRDIAYDGIKVPAVLDTYAESIVVNSFSKSLSLPGERIGYIAVNPAIADKKLLMDGFVMANRILGFVNAPALMQRAVSEGWRAKADIARYERRRNQLVAALDAAKIEYAKPEGAFYMFCKVPARKAGAQLPTGASASDTADVAFAMHLKSHNILGVPGIGFGYPGYIRLCYCVPETVISAAAPAFAKAVAAWLA